MRVPCRARVRVRIALLCVLGIAVALVVLIRVQADRAARTEQEHVQAFCHLWSGLRWYGFHNGGLPDPVARDAFGQPLFSWRATVLSSTHSVDMPQDKEAPWYWPENRFWANLRHRWFCYTRNSKEDPDSFENHVWAVTGPGTAFDPQLPHRLKELPPHCILLIEAGTTNTHWMAPGDLDASNVPPWITRGTDGTGVVVLFADGEAWLLHRTVPLADLCKFFTVEGAKRFDRVQLLGPYCQMLKKQPQFK